MMIHKKGRYKRPFLWIKITVVLNLSGFGFRFH